MDILHLDYETASDADLTKVGLDVYSSLRSRPRVLMAAYRINDDPLEQWQAHESRFPRDLKDALLDPKCLRWAFNSQFERVITQRVLGIPTPIEGWRCSMCLAYMESFTGQLQDVGEQIGLPLDKLKMKDGKRLIRKFTIPQKVTTNQPHLWRNWVTDEEDWELFSEYNRQDVIAEEAIKKRLLPFPILEDEWNFYHLDQEINDRGIPVDMEFVENVIWMAARRKAELNAQMAEITGLDNPNSVSQLLPWLQDRGYPYDDIRKESVEKTLKRLKAGEIGCTTDCKTVLELRQWSSRTSTSKALTAQKVVGDDGFARFLFQFAGASRTGRFSGRTIQSQNMTRTPKLLDAEETDEKLSFVTDLIRNGDYDGFDLVLTEPMLGFTGCMRSLFRAPEGYVFVTCDLAQIEFIGLGWVAECLRIIDVYLSGRDPYKDFGVDFYKKQYEEINGAERQICKPPVLACGYRLGRIGLVIYAENMGVDMTPDEAARAVTIYREKFPEVKDFWTNCEKAIKYVLMTHKPYKLGFVTFEWLKPYMLIRLPSGRCIYYYKPRLEDRIIRTGKTVRKRVRSRGNYEDGAPEGQWITIEEEDTYVKKTFTYMGRNQKNAQWERLDGHGGVITENIVQALTRDILKVGLQRVKKVGFNIIHHGHDEIMALVKRGDNYFTLDRMREAMTAPIGWAPGFPLKAAGWVGDFYRK